MYEGIVDFGVSENKLMFDVFEKKLAEPKIQKLAPHMLFYDVMAGNMRFRGALAEFLTERLNAAKPLDPKNSCAVVCTAITTISNSFNHIELAYVG
ncbi:ACCS [Branchiostoma lanceolatum]|uniref:ACCS protein n=1 Tax=Branchiostoma lanceolatum TaxID=7740 RepID=A0A8K0EJX0_BRALA|nr:ACCS [Branchiostoma lanceolatum]